MESWDMSTTSSSVKPTDVEREVRESLIKSDEIKLYLVGMILVSIMKVAGIKIKKSFKMS